MPFRAGCVGLIVGAVIWHVGAALGQLTVTVDIALGAVHAAVLGNWIESSVGPVEASCTSANVAPLPVVFTVLSSVLPENRLTSVPAGALVVMVTSIWNPSPQVLVLSLVTVSVAPFVGAVKATV